ncbi:hypothetical protein [Clavibacter michiganensis]|uniref:hypothetical protein n=1 Tax=Clavibacter michiganensis TaxID=28447 RepID=UPI003EBAF5B9
MAVRNKVLATFAIIAAFTLSAGAETWLTAKHSRPTTEGDPGFYVDSEIDAAWQQAAESFPLPLPPGKTFPNEAPAFFHPKDDKTHSFDTSLPMQFAARYWRCAWLEQSLHPPTSAATEVSPSTSEIEAHLDSSEWKSIPAVENNMDVDAYLQDMKKYADSVGGNAREIEYESECNLEGNE